MGAWKRCCFLCCIDAVQAGALAQAHATLPLPLLCLKPAGVSSTSAGAAGPEGPSIHTEEAQLGGKRVQLESGLLAQLADGSVVVRQGSTAVLVTVVGAAEPEGEGDFLPLQVGLSLHAVWHV